nr:MFS transporter [Streptomyces sp. WAC01526]
MIREQRTMMAVGWLFIAVAGPQALLSPFFGRLADRFDRRTLWIGCDATSALLALGLPLWLACGGAPGPGIYGANLGLAVVSALFLPASSALIKERVPAGRLRRFNARYEMGTQAGMLLSATVGGLSVQAFGAVPLLVLNAGTFMVSALCVAAVGRRPDPAPAATAAGEQAPVPAAPRGPLRVRRFILLYAQGSVVVTVFNALLPTAVIGELHLGAAAFGVVDALGCLGFLAATGAYRIVSRRHPDLRIAVVGFLLCNAGLVLQSQFGIAGYLVGVPLGAFFFGQARIASRTMLMASADDASVGQGLRAGERWRAGGHGRGDVPGRDGHRPQRHALRLRGPRRRRTAGDPVRRTGVRRPCRGFDGADQRRVQTVRQCGQQRRSDPDGGLKPQSAGVVGGEVVLPVGGQVEAVSAAPPRAPRPAPGRPPHPAVRPGTATRPPRRAVR